MVDAIGILRPYTSYLLECGPIIYADVCIIRVLSGYLTCYGAATSQILAIYENFLVYAISVLLLVYSLFLLKTSSLQKGNAEQGKRKFTVDCFLSLFFARSKPWRLTKNAYPKFSG
ncbi:hypothetical protein D4A49_01940 [Escherichia coli]|nr:hypothetical protein [Escherichia coli]